MYVCEIGQFSVKKDMSKVLVVQKDSMTSQMDAESNYELGK